MDTSTKLLTVMTLVGMGIAVGAGESHAASNLTPQRIAVGCTSGGTGLDGRRKACDSEWVTLRAPVNHVFAERSLAGGLTSGNGSEQECRVSWGDLVEVLPGISQPTTISIQAHARSPKHDRGARGWAKCVYTINIVNYQK